MKPVTLAQKKTAVAQALIGEMIPKLLRQVVECPACGLPVSPREGEFLPVRDADEVARAWFLFHPGCIQSDTDSALQDIPDNNISVIVYSRYVEVATDNGPVRIPIAGEIRKDEPIWTGNCCVCGLKAYWKDSQRLETGDWIHTSCNEVLELLWPEG